MNPYVLIVEDDEFICETIEMILSGEGFEVVCKSNGQAALDYLESAKVLPGLILLDLMMPIKDGYEFRAEQLVRPKIANIPVILMTAEGTISDRKVKLKAKDIILKPFDVVRLIELVKKRVCSPQVFI